MGVAVSVCRLREKGAYVSLRVCMCVCFMTLELLRYVLRCAIGRHL